MKSSLTKAAESPHLSNLLKFVPFPQDAMRLRLAHRKWANSEKSMTWDDYKKKSKLPPHGYSKFAKLLISNKILIFVAIYIAIFFIWPAFQGPESPIQ